MHCSGGGGKEEDDEQRTTRDMAKRTRPRSSGLAKQVRSPAPNTDTYAPKRALCNTAGEAESNLASLKRQQRRPRGRGAEDGACLDSWAFLGRPSWIMAVAGARGRAGGRFPLLRSAQASFPSPGGGPSISGDAGLQDPSTVRLPCPASTARSACRGYDFRELLDKMVATVLAEERAAQSAYVRRHLVLISPTRSTLTTEKNT
ncbi:unnamed protein product [Prorocentrum cordatum]|uniref:Uncharacterized protein n=1 Tax=Prorocentrum cordatum TaxID=2364126 RepID=A0ABN9T8Q4_9DINO|nr:unnamed protein product [Polarella glacialis]